MPRNPRVTVCIPTKNRLEELKRMKASLDKQTFRDFEVLVIDANDVPGGLVKQVNHGLDQAKGEIFIRTDDDAEASSQWLEEIVKVFDRSSRIGGVTGPTIYPDMGSRDIFSLQKKLFWPLNILYYDYIQEGSVFSVGKVWRSGALSLGSNYFDVDECKHYIWCEVDVHDCCTFACRTDIIRKVGGFDEAFGGVGDFNETDMSFKIRKAGYQIIFNPNAYVYHHTSKAGVFQERADATAGRVRNFRIWFHRWLKPNPRYYIYLLFMNLYYTYKFLTTRQVGYLGSWRASIWRYV